MALQTPGPRIFPAFIVSAVRSLEKWRREWDCLRPCQFALRDSWICSRSSLLRSNPRPAAGFSSHTLRGQCGPPKQDGPQVAAGRFEKLAEGLELRWTVLYCLYSWALVQLCFMHGMHGDVLRHSQISGILMESQHSVADGDDATNRSLHPGNPVVAWRVRFSFIRNTSARSASRIKGRLPLACPPGRRPRKPPRKGRSRSDQTITKTTEARRLTASRSPPCRISSSRWRRGR